MDKQELEPTTSSDTMAKHIFKFDDDTKSTLMNISQYTVLAIIPIMILQNIIDRLSPEHDDAKGTIELLAEILGQSLTTLIGIFFVHRLITSVPTFSGTAMGDLNMFSIVVVLLLTTFMIDGKVSRKIKTVSNRLLDVWDGKSDDKKQHPQKKSHQASVVSISQPISGMGHSMPSAAMGPPPPQITQQQAPPPQQQMGGGMGGMSGMGGGIQEQYTNLPPEPTAYNNSGGAFSTF